MRAHVPHMEGAHLAGRSGAQAASPPPLISPLRPHLDFKLNFPSELLADKAVTSSARRSFLPPPAATNGRAGRAGRRAGGRVALRWGRAFIVFIGCAVRRIACAGARRGPR